MVTTNASEIAQLNRYQSVDDNASVVWLEKAQSGKVSLDDIQDALMEFANLFKAGMASKAEILTLARAFPDTSTYTNAAKKQSDENDNDPIVIGGPASVSLVDREGHLITTGALERAFQKFMKNDRTRNVMVLHSDVQVGWALPAYISKGGQIFKSGVDTKGLFFICELRDDTSIAKKVADQIHKGMLKSYSIAGSATKIQNMTKGLVPYMQVDDMELAEVTVCEKGVNQGASFEILKAEMPSIAEPPRITAPMRKMNMYSNEDGTINFTKSFTDWLVKEKDPLTTKESFVTLNNEEGRQAEHAQLLREYGFPSAQPIESMRYVPVAETETDDDGIPVHNLPPWVVNEAGEALGDRLDEDSPGYKKSDKAKARQKAGSAQKMFMDFMEKDMGQAKFRGGKKNYGLNPKGKRGSKGAASTTIRPYMQKPVEPKEETVEKQGREGLSPERERPVQEMSDREAAAQREREASERDKRIGERAAGRSAADAAQTTGGEATGRVGTSRPEEPPSTPASFSRGKGPSVQRPERSEYDKQRIQGAAFRRKVGRGITGGEQGRQNRAQVRSDIAGAGRAVGDVGGRVLGTAGRGIGRLFGAGKERAGAMSRGAAGGIKGFGQEVKRGYRRQNVGETEDTRQRGFGAGLTGQAPDDRRASSTVDRPTMASRMGRLFRGTQEEAGKRTGQAVRGGVKGAKGTYRGAKEALGGASEGYRSYDPSTQKFRRFPGEGDKDDYLRRADHKEIPKPSAARRIGRMFGQTGRGFQEATVEGGKVGARAAGKGIGAGTRFGAGTAAGLAGTSGARTGEASDIGGRGRFGRAGYRLGRVGREFGRGAMRGGTPSERLRGGRDASRFGEGAREGGRESTAERMGRYFGTGSRGAGRIGVTAGRVGGKKTGQFIGEHAPRVGAGSRRGRAERAAGAASLDAEHASIGIGGNRTINHHLHHGKSYAESNNLVSDMRQNQGPKSIGDHLAIYQHMLSNHHGDHQGDKIVHTSLHLPEGMTHNSVIDNHAFVSMMHPEGGHAGYQPTTDYQNNHQGVMDNVHKVLGQYAGGKIPPKMDTGTGQRTIQSEASAPPPPATDTQGIPTGEGRTPGIPPQSTRQMMGIGNVPVKPPSTAFQQIPPTGQTPPTGPNRKRPELDEITASIDKMLNKALRSKSRGYSKGWGGKRHVNR